MHNFSHLDILDHDFAGVLCLICAAPISPGDISYQVSVHSFLLPTKGLATLLLISDMSNMAESEHKN